MTTIGVILQVPEPWQTTLQAYRERIGDPMGDHIPPHITLLPPVDVADAVMPTVEDHLIAAAATVEPIQIRLAGTDSFRPLSPVVFVDVVGGAEECAALEKAVRTGPLGVDAVWPYHPHVTVAHDMAEPVLDAAEYDFAHFEAEFTAGSLHLFVHDPDGWRLAREFRLGR